MELSKQPYFDKQIMCSTDFPRRAARIEFQNLRNPPADRVPIQPTAGDNSPVESRSWGGNLL